MANKDRIELFNQWSKNYDQSVISAGDYPFDGYKQVLDRIVELSKPTEKMNVLDIGTGTGNLTEEFFAKKANVWGLDYSNKMLAEAKKKYPLLKLIEADIMGNWIDKVEEKFDCIVSGYVFHEFDLAAKIQLIQKLFKNVMTEKAYLIIGDIAFPTQKNLDHVKQISGEKWDDEEFYWVADETIKICDNLGFRAEYEQISSCGGVFVIRQKLD